MLEKMGGVDDVEREQERGLAAIRAKEKGEPSCLRGAGEHLKISFAELAGRVSHLARSKKEESDDSLVSVSAGELSIGRKRAVDNGW